MTDTSKEAVEAQINVVYESRAGRGVRAGTCEMMRALEAERDAFKAENQRLRGRLANLLIREKDVNRALVLFRTSNNAHGFINFHSLTSRIDGLPEVARNELAGLMFAVAYEIDADEVLQRVAALKGDKT